MKRKFLLIVFFFFLFFNITEKQSVNAASCPNLTLQGYNSPIILPTQSINVNIIGANCFIANSHYAIVFTTQNATVNDLKNISQFQILLNQTASDTQTLPSSWDLSGSALTGLHLPDGNYDVLVCFHDGSFPSGSSSDVIATYDVSGCVQSGALVGRIPITISSGQNPSGNNKLPKIDPAQQQACVFQVKHNVQLNIGNLDKACTGTNHNYGIWIKGQGGTIKTFDPPNPFPSAPNVSEIVPIDGNNFPNPGDQIVCVDGCGNRRETDANCIKLSFFATPPTGDLSCSANNGGSNQNANASCSPACPTGQSCVDETSFASGVNFGPFGSAIQTLFTGGNLPSVCIPNTPTPLPCKTNEQCVPYACDTTKGVCNTNIFLINGSPVPSASPLCPNNQCQTAIGTIPIDPAGFVSKLVSIILGLSGGIATLLIIIAGYTLLSSQGNPEKVQGAKETLTSAIAGLLFIIFAFVILQVITVDILHIPGFGK